VRQLVRDVDGLGWGDDGRLGSFRPAHKGRPREQVK
jgi:hypothetical protein